MATSRLAVPGRKPTDHQVGAAAELTAATHYLRKGFNIYWPQVQQDGTDFILDRDGVPLRVQVKTAQALYCRGNEYISAVTLSGTRTRAYRERRRPFDLLVVVYGDRIWEIPASEITKTRVYLDGGRKTRVWDRYELA